ncbi:MAG: hypothetical protein V7752_05175, partial [Halopseudomonas sp.]
MSSSFVNKKFLVQGLGAALLSLGALISANAAQADFPERPVSMVVPYSPGGATDFQARIVTMLAGDDKYLQQPM